MQAQSKVSNIFDIFVYLAILNLRNHADLKFASGILSIEKLYTVRIVETMITA